MFGRLMYDPQNICEKYFLPLLILLELDSSGIESIQPERKTLMGIDVLHTSYSQHK